MSISTNDLLRHFNSTLALFSQSKNMLERDFKS